jgi:FAD/FMN-containing dehydrogenase
MAQHPSWGLYPAADQKLQAIEWRDGELDFADASGALLPRGLGRSYGDSCLIDGGTLLDTTRLNHLIEFDRETGRLRCEAGVSFAELLEVIVPHGWFLPVTPGTCQVTVAGALANDVHGKNHHRAGTFGCFVSSFELCRSDGSRLLCSPQENAELFRATIGGLGLTGLISWVEFQLKRVPGVAIDVESVRFKNLDGFFEIAADSDAHYEYTVAWIDCMASGRDLGRGLFFRGNHAESAGDTTAPSSHKLNVPIHAPGMLLNRWSLRTFNALYYARQRQTIVRRRTHFAPFFYPLDAIDNWNRLYGKRGFLQYQCLVPAEDGAQSIRSVLERIVDAGEGSFLAVLKIFGDVPSPGLLSFPRPGLTLALDFPNRGHSTFHLLEELDSIVRRVGGSVYPAKDARMSPHSFRSYFPHWQQLEALRDPRLCSSFWQRVTREESRS